ncbi:isopentenyl-diphosphate Delta-isomerase [Jannaschia donghaensis]|uniref:Isopentenyl-diphosphate Delta-isomerase n=1 Tax=Jannaschia donghaensis TaxID=420998 RepID=A0A0M6YFM6_9RHOB|nr:isopentenyl-diphosphate Delta-isomerase [Jannaschia donghaensis]CTQ49161.1 Isopentenyl-diphosphate Delta-isomerase [Jannaschia donghaensis]
MTFDTVTPTGQIMIPAWVDGTLRPVEKLEAHQRGLKHKAVSVFVMSGDRLLIQKRAQGKYHTPGLWANTCCTHPHWGEDARDCAIRRLDDELGITGVSLTRREPIEYRADVGGGLIEHEVAEVFIGMTDQSLSITPRPDEVETTRWAPMADLMREIEETPDGFTPWIRIYLRNHHARIFGGVETS